ncbi:MAG TPA: IS66 family transposase [Acidimicrobiales bacterium]|nr:IS66 family transposase [Acidimicrobiales bacterium]
MIVEIAHLRELLERNVAELAKLNERLSQRDARIAELERLLSESRRSGKRQAAPFSKGNPKEEPAKPGRCSGDAHGRHGHRMAPVAAPDREIDVPLSSCCPDCGGDVELERTAEQFQVDLPAMRPVTTRFNLGVGRCKGCGRRVQARHGEQTSDALGAASSQVGPITKAWAAWLHYGLGLSFGKTANLLHRLGIDLTAGALSQAAQSTSTALVPVQNSIVKEVNDSKMIVPDESGWRVGGEGAWLWAVSSARATAYWVADGRGFDEACEVISPEYSGVMVRDGWAPYRRFDKATHQTCVAHLLRRCDELITDLPAGAKHTPRRVRQILTEALDARDLDDDERAAVVADLAERVEMLADDAHPENENRKLVAHLYKEREALFTFLTHPGTDATNWRAEQAIRPAVVNRKVWGGNRTWRGAVTQGRIMSVLRTASQQQVDAIDFLTRLARAPTTAEVPSLFI